MKRASLLRSPSKNKTRSSLARRLSRKNVSADSVVAATAGADNWKTWAGRSDGSDDFEWMDLVRGAKRKLQHKMLRHVPPPGSTCPVCFCEPENEQEWHVTSSCSHAICIDCFQGYAKSQVLDPEQSGPLKCPVCPRVLRRKDATTALAGDRELIRQWDLKIRNQLLRALPAFRACPRCNDVTNEDNGGGGGGFVTPECLAPQYQERRDTANHLLNGTWMVRVGWISVYLLLVSYIGNQPSQSALLDFLSILAPTSVLVKVVVASEVWVAENARQALGRPIKVQCPCCSHSFILPAETKAVADAQTQQWIGENTRACPSCSVPISKISGCNHMRCAHCQANFCWACMRLRTDCKAYKCRNGAPFQDAVPMLGSIGDDRGGRFHNDSIQSHLDQIMDRRDGSTPLHIWDGVILVFALFARDSIVIEKMVSVPVAMLSFLLSNQVLKSIVAFVTMGVNMLTWIVVMFASSFWLIPVMWSFRDSIRQSMRQALVDVRMRLPRNFAQQGGLRNARHNPMAVLGADERNRGDRAGNLMFMSEDDMVQEAIRRSLREQ